MGIFTSLFGFLAVPLGFILNLVYQLVDNYFISIFLFTLLIRLLMFPLSLRSQKTQAERIKLQPRLERLQKKYSQDRQKLQQKTTELYEREGVSMTGGCMPMLVQMIVLFGVISVIYAPLQYLAKVPTNVIDAAVSAVNIETYYQKDENGNVLKDADGKALYIEGANIETKVDPKDLQGYYRELNMMQHLETNKTEVLEAIGKLDGMTAEKAESYYNEILRIRGDFRIGKYSLLETPWRGGAQDISLLWLIPLISGLTAAASSVLSMYFTKKGTSSEKQPGQGCSNVMMLVMMPAFSLYITFIVPGGVGIYWICSNLISILQVFVLNMIYNPAKLREQAIREDEERRRRKAEDKKRLAESRKREQQALAEEAKAAEQAAPEKPSQKKQPPATKNPNKLKKKEAAEKAGGIESGELKEPELVEEQPDDTQQEP